MSIEAHDVVVIGGGIIGISLAYFLAKEGVDVCRVEKKSLAMQSSGRCAGGIGQSHREEPDLPLAKFSVQLWKLISEEMEMNIEYRLHGNLRLAMNEEHAASFQAMVERERAGRLEVRFLDHAETKSCVPYVAEPIMAAFPAPPMGWQTRSSPFLH
jgi:glycine/D-amino acid oxidase-like deaminating enzyme